MKILQVNEDGEYMSTEFQKKLKKIGVEWQPQSPYIPKQKKKVER